MTSTPTRSAPAMFRKAAALVVASVVALYLLRLAFLLAFADELPGSPSSALPGIPSSVRVVEEGQRCASGGCWWELTLDPPDGESPAELASELGVASEECVPGNLWDPRQECVGSLERAGQLVVYSARRSLG